MKKLTFKSLLLLMALAFVGTTFTSCGESEPEVVVGCMDADADNYDELANTDSGNCAYGTRFIGEYDGTFGCQLLPFTAAELSITEIAGNTQSLNTIVVSAAVGTIPLTATIVDKDNISLDASLPAQDLSGIEAIMMQFGSDARFDIDVAGVLTLQANGNLEGTVGFTLTEVALNLGIDPLVDSCTFVATPK